jgi:ATPase subunit of ABC transporter with duplicated ATPase domains
MGDRDRHGHCLTETPPLVVSNLVAGYRDPVVGPVSFTVEHADIVGLAGPNGAGKTTIFNAIIGMAQVFVGQIARAPGTVVSIQRQHPVRLREMPLTGRELLRLTGAFDRPLPPALAPLMDVRIDRISGGQFQLLQVWACLGSAADLVLLDEPTNNMDPKAIAALVELLLGARDGRAVLVISHDRHLLDRVCTRLVEIGR